MCQGLTEFLFLGYLTELTWTPSFRYGTLPPNTNLQTYWQKDISHVTNEIIFFVCSTSAISALFVAPRTSACSAASPKGCREGCKNNQKRTGLWLNPGQWWSTWPVLLVQVLLDRFDFQRGLMQAQNKFHAASSSQGWQRDTKLFTSTGKPLATEHQGCSGNNEIPEGSEDSKTQKSNLATFRQTVSHREKVFSIVRNIYDWNPTDNLKGLDVNTAIWGIFMSVTLQAAVHLGRD